MHAVNVQMPDTAEIVVKDIASLEKALEELQGIFDGEALWWRGHCRESWSLEAGVFRPTPKGGIFLEHALISHFQNRAVGMLGHRARPESEIEWIFLAQHYGLPTRLLDWTESPLIALFFALRDEDNGQDSCLWVLSPSHLNKEQSCPANPSEAQFGLIATDEKVARAMAMQAFGFKNEALSEVLKFSPSELPKIIAIETPEMDARIVAQSGRFTLHASPNALAIPSTNFLRKIVVPADAKQNLRVRLDWLGMREWNLFPDLGSLAHGLRNHEFSVAVQGGE
jgi:FRG domain